MGASTFPELTRTKRRSVFIHLTPSGRGVIEFLLHSVNGQGVPGGYHQPAAVDLKSPKSAIQYRGQDCAGTDTKLTLIADSKTSVTLPFDPGREISTSTLELER
jgi:hypothetical protein